MHVFTSCWEMTVNHIFLGFLLISAALEFYKTSLLTQKHKKLEAKGQVDKLYVGVAYEKKMHNF